MESEEFIWNICVQDSMKEVGSVGTLLQKESGIGNSLTLGDELVCVFKKVLLHTLKFWSLGN
jgi:hypothetical protein